VGAATEIELKEKQERVKDAVEATRAAVEEGIVPGGGVALLKSRVALDKIVFKNEDEKVALDVLRFALEQPIRDLAKNSGADDGYVIRKIEEGLKKSSDFGFNVATLEFGSVLASGIVDPLKVTRLALQNAASVGAMVLTTEALVTDLPEKKEAPGGGGGRGMPSLPQGGF